MAQYIPRTKRPQQAAVVHLQEVKNNVKTIKPSGQKVVAVTFDTQSLTKGSKNDWENSGLLDSW